jgi:hypothetical protein
MVGIPGVELSILPLGMTPRIAEAALKTIAPVGILPSIVGAVMTVPVMTVPVMTVPVTSNPGAAMGTIEPWGMPREADIIEPTGMAPGNAAEFAAGLSLPDNPCLAFV